MESGKSLRNKGFMGAVTLDGRRPALNVGKSKFKDLSSNSNETEGVRTRFRSGSVTTTHMHGTAMGTATHKDREGVTHTITASQMNATTKDWVRARHGK